MEEKYDKNDRNNYYLSYIYIYQLGLIKYNK